MANPEFLSAFTSGLIFLSVSLIVTFALNSFFSYKLAKVQKEILKHDQEATEVNRELNRSINALRSEFGFKAESPHKPMVPHILRMRWLDYTRDNIETVPFVQWTANELAKRLESESNKTVQGKDGYNYCAGNCGMNYCDENGCIDRKRESVDPTDETGKEATNV